MNYIPLHIHSEYTFLESALKIIDLKNIAETSKISSIGIADVNNAYAFPSFYDAFKNTNTKPIFGSTISLKTKDNICPLCIYVKNEQGYRNLCKIINLKKNLTIKELDNYKKGLILVIPCGNNSFISSLFENANYENISKIIFAIQKGFEDFYFGMEIYKEEDKVLMNKIRDFSSNYTYKTIAFPLHLYQNRNDAFTLKILNAIKNDEKLERDLKITGPYFFLGEKAVSQLYLEAEIKATFDFDKEIDFNFGIKRGSLLCYDLEDSTTNKREYIYNKCIENAKKNNLTIDDTTTKRLNYELNTIEKMGYLDYFLIVADYVNAAKNNNIPVGPGRGSAAGSLVSYCLNITTVNPLKYDLLFERFLNPERITMPDIDVDFADTKRNDVIDYIAKRYGNNRMANIISFQTIGAKQSLRDIGRVFNYNILDINTLSNACRGKDLSLDETIKEIPDFASLAKDSYFSNIINLAKLIEGYPRQTGLHAAGIILNNDDLSSVVPTDIGEDGRLICEYEAIYLENQGFLKMDILGLRNLSVIESITNRIKQKNKNFDINSLPLDDSKTFETLRLGLTQGVFQMESSGMIHAIKEISISSFDDIVASIALYRPGPMEFIKVYAENKNTRKEIKYIHPSLEEILKPTFGVIIYQEQIMQIVQKIASFSLAQADLFRRAISKKDETKLQELKSSFIEGGLKNNIDENTVEEIYQMIYKFADYGFNKSHSVVYSMICYQLAYLKTHYSSEFYASLLDFQSLSDAKYTKYLQELKHFKIKLALPDVNIADIEYKVLSNDKIVIPFTAIKGLPIDISNAIIFERNQNGPFNDPLNFISRMEGYHINQKQIDTLIDSGSLDCFKQTRTTLRKSSPLLLSFIRSIKSDNSLLSEEELDVLSPEIIEIEEDLNLKYKQEMETLGILLSGSLFEKYYDYLSKKNVKNILDSMEINNQKFVSVAAIITDIKVMQTKKKTTMAILNTYDDSTLIEMVLFPDIYEKEKIKLEKNKPLLFRGYFKNDSIRGMSFIVDSIENLEANKQ